MRNSDLVIEVFDIKGYCPVYQVGDTFSIKDGFVLAGGNPICMHSLASLMPYYVALSQGTSPVELGLAREGEVAYLQCLDPCELTRGGTVVFAVRRVHHNASLARSRERSDQKMAKKGRKRNGTR